MQKITLLIWAVYLSINTWIFLERDLKEHHYNMLARNFLDGKYACEKTRKVAGGTKNEAHE